MKKIVRDDKGQFAEGTIVSRERSLRPGGFRCPRCDGTTKVTDSRLLIGGEVRRKRLCSKGHTFVTLETRAEDNLRG